METKFIGHIVDVKRREIYDGEVIVNDGIITAVNRCVLPECDHPYSYLMPGFVDGHVHVESSMMNPYEFARIAATHGTIGVIADPHEIANVMGVEGVEYMITIGKKSAINFLFGAPSCVPSCGGDIETSGATLDADDIERLMERDDIGFLGEMMNYVGVLNDDPQVMAKINAALRHGKPVDGHAPGVVGNDRRRYAAAGISTDHECATLEEGRSCIKEGMKVIIREGSAAKDYELLKPLIDESPESVMFCTDDCHPDDLVRGHIDAIVKRAIIDGFDLWNILQAACVNPQEHYHCNWGLLQPGDPATFLIVENLGAHFRIRNTVVNGEKVFSYNYSSSSIHTYLNTLKELIPFMADFPNNFKAKPITVADIHMDLRGGDTAHVIRVTDGSLYTGHDEIELSGNPLIDSHYPWREVQKIVVYNRYESDARPIVGLIRGFNISGGAMAATVAHDCHNIVAVGDDEELIVKAINRVIEMHGGQVVVSKDEMLDLPLPIAGLMAPLGAHEIAYRGQMNNDMVKELGCTMKSPFITMAFMCLPVIPELKITDKHLWDGLNMKPVG